MVGGETQVGGGGGGRSFDILGQAVHLPVAIRAARMASATYLVDQAPVARLLAPSGLEVLPVTRRKTIAALAFVVYEDGDLGAYNEVALAFTIKPVGAVEPGAKARPSTFIHRLPVDGEFTMEAGRQIWGFPKWITESAIRFDDRSASCFLRDDGEPVLAAHSRRGRVPLPGRELVMDAYTFHEGVVRRTPWVMDLKGVRTRLGGTSLVVGDGSPMASELRQIGLPRRALMTTVVDRVTGRFEAAETLSPGGR